ncbi:MAG: hypothetical protein IT211_14490 [Armatimonadetes bacterium]|nr:hypothetical protein [Armatimonadota bacterium]
MSFVTFANGMLKFTLPKNMLCHIQLQWQGSGAKKMTIDGDPNMPVIYASCPPLTPPPPNAKFVMLAPGQAAVHDVMLNTNSSRDMKITPYHENGTPCPQIGGIDPDIIFTAGIELWTYQDPNDPRYQISSWLMISAGADSVSCIIIVEPDSGGGGRARKLMKEEPFMEMNAYLSVVHKTLQALIDTWNDDFVKIK